MILLLTSSNNDESAKQIVTLFENIYEKVTSIGSWYASLGTFGKILDLLLTTLIVGLIVLIVLKIISQISKKFIKKQKNIQLRFLVNIIRAAIVIIGVIWILTSSEATASFGKMLFQGTAILGAVIGLAAQPIIADLFCGLMISIGKPFEIGDRIELENGMAGIVMDITMRHVVLRQIDTVDVIIPNSKLNGMSITNMSHGTKIRSVHFRFPIAYDSDVEKAMDAIKSAVIESPYTIEGRPSKEKEGEMEYGPVYFIAYADSSLTMATTVYYEPTVTTEVLKNDINMRVNKAFKENGIEIPYNYVNVVMRQ